MSLFSVVLSSWYHSLSTFHIFSERASLFYPFVDPSTAGWVAMFLSNIFNLRPVKDIDVSQFLWPVQSSSLFFISHIPNVLRSKKITDDNCGLPSIALQRQLLLQWFQDKL